MKKTSVILSLLYLLSLLASFYTLYQLPTYLVMSRAVDLIQLDLAQSVFYQLNAILALSFVLGGAALVSLWMDRRGEATVAGPAPEEARPGLLHDDEAPDQEIDEAPAVEELNEVISNHGDDQAVFSQALSLICQQVAASLAVAYKTKHTDEYAYLELFASYAYPIPEGSSIAYRFGEGLAGQVAKQGSGMSIDEVPEGYIKIFSGLGGATPTYLMIHPLKCDESVVGVVEISSFTQFSPHQREYIEAALNRLALKLANTDNVSLEEATN